MQLSSIKKQLLMFILISALAGSAVYLFFTYGAKSKPAKEIKHGETTDTSPDFSVSFKAVSKGLYSSSITVYGKAHPLYQADLCSGVAGKVIHVSNQLKKGIIVEKNQILIKIDDTAFKSKFAGAELALAQAKLALLREKQEAGQALKEWQHSGLKGVPGSPLVLREPQLKAAQNQLKAAKAELRSAGKELESCIMRAPFQGLIVNPQVNKGQWIIQGQKIAEIFNLQKIKIEISLDPAQWAMLEKDITKTDVQLFDMEQKNSWKAVIIREGKRIIPESQLRQLFCEVKKPLEQNPPLLAGTFLILKLKGRTIPNLLKLPESSLTKQGLVWYKKKDNTLGSFHGEVRFFKKNHVFITAPEYLSYPVLIARYPNNSFINGLSVKARIIPMGE